MATNKLTDTRCKNEKAGPKPRKISDGNGMYLYISTAGAKIWRMAYSDGGKEQVKVLGPYPLLSLAEARTMRDEFKLKLVKGESIKPSQTLKTMSFKDAYTKYWNDRRQELVGKTCTNALRGIEMYLSPLDNKQMRDITRTELLDCLLVLNSEKKFSYARKVRGWVSQVFRWAQAQEYCESDPADAINPRYAFGRKPVEHFASLKMSEIPAFLDRLAFEPVLQSVLACRVLAYTWLRTKELRNMLWTHIEGDVIRFPPSVMKLKREHLVPISPQVAALLEELKIRSRGSPYVFPNDRDQKRPMSENSILYLIGRIGYAGKMTGHGWRHIASTWANEQINPDETKKFHEDWVEMQLAHTDEDKVRSTYNSAEYLSQRRRMLTAWAEHLDKIDPSRLKSGEPPQDSLAT